LLQSAISLVQDALAEGKDASSNDCAQ